MDFSCVFVRSDKVKFRHYGVLHHLMGVSDGASNRIEIAMMMAARDEGTDARMHSSRCIRRADGLRRRGPAMPRLRAMASIEADVGRPCIV